MQASDTAYCDAQGRPQLRGSVTGFIDLLGFSQGIMSQQSMAESQQTLEQILEAIRDSRSYVQAGLASRQFPIPAQSAVKFFSDNLVLGVPCGGDPEDLARNTLGVVLSAQRYQLRMALHGLFARGGLTYGPLCLTDEIIFGAALIDAYRMESNVAIVPRIVLAEQLSRPIVQLSRDQQCQQSAADSICRDIDGLWFVNYLEAARTEQGLQWEDIAMHKQRVGEALSRTPAHNVLPKYGWVIRYHNMFCHWHREDPGYSASYRIERVDEDSVIERLADVV